MFVRGVNPRFRVSIRVRGGSVRIRMKVKASCLWTRLRSTSRRTCALCMLVRMFACVCARVRLLVIGHLELVEALAVGKRTMCALIEVHCRGS